MEDIINRLDEINNDLIFRFGTSSYETRCKLHDIKEMILKLDSKYCTCLNRMSKPINDTDCECFNCGKMIK